MTNYKCYKLEKWFWWFSWLYSRPNNKNSTHIDAYDFSASPQPPQTIQTCYNNRFLGFLAWRDSKVHASFRTAGTVLCGLHWTLADVSTRNMVPLTDTRWQAPGTSYRAPGKGCQVQDTVPAVRKDAISNSNSLFLGSKTGVRIDNKFHHMAPN